MKKTIIACYKMFTNKTTVCVVDGFKIIEGKDSTIDGIVDDIIELANKYEIETVNIKGNKKYSAKLKTDLLEEGMSKYNKTFKVNLIK
mgnify:FL=1